MLNILTDAIEHNLEVDLVYLDFAKAFDSVPHRKLIHKLDQYGVTGQLLLWIKYFLSSRRQQVRVTSALFDWASVISGVPQGTVFGTIMFILFINNLPRDILAKLFLFADDTKLFQALFSAVFHQELQSDKGHLIEWSNKWQLKFNTSKCKVKHTGSVNTSSYSMLDLNYHKLKELGRVH